MTKFNMRSKLMGLLVGALLVQGITVNAQQTLRKPLADVSESSIVLKGERYTFPSNYRTLQLDQVAMEQLLSMAPEESSYRTSGQVVFNMPMPDGTTQAFSIFKSVVMHPDLAANFPELKTFAGYGIDHPEDHIRLDITPLGFHAMILSPRGQVFIDPYSTNTTTDYICYYKKDVTRTTSFSCETEDLSEDLQRSIPSNYQGQRSSGTQLRTYRLALAGTGEYTATKGGTVSGGLAGMVTSMNRVNGVYETEVSIRMVLVANNNLLVYTDGATDPYTNGNGSTMLSQNITNCNTVIGSANYDIGHVFSTGGGGVAGLGVVCGTNKARGVTGQSNPVGDPFDIDYVAHEMGHQFAGNHTFNSSTSSCSGNRAASAAYEPGSGITIMAYAGICGSDNLASNSIAYFHTKSFDEIVIFSTTGTGNNCPVITATGNTPPVVTSMGANYTIPISTPFVLTGAATDANGHALTYSWEQFDLGTAGAWNANLGSAPIFRPFTPTTSPSRTFPKLSDIINNTVTVGEILPNVARTMHFQLTVRDNIAGGGGVMHPDSTVSITVANTGGAFAVTAPNTAVTWAGGSTQTVTWNVSGTSGAPINTANVKISLSTDGGNTFSTVILASTANDGTESITVPNIATTQARIKVEAVGNIYFDMSNANFTITSSAFSSITTSSIATTNYCAGAALNVSFTTNGSANAGNIFTAQLSNASGSFASPDSIGSLTSTTAGTIACVIPAGTASGTGYRIRVVSSNPAVTGSNNGANLTISAQVAAAGAPQSGFTSYCANIPVIFTVGSIANATNYTWSVNAGGIITNGQGTTQVTIVFPPGQPTIVATVSVFGSNANCTGTAGTANFTIFNTPNTPTANNATGCAGTPISLSGSPAGGIFSVANPYTGPSTTFTYTITTINGCNATSTPATITVNPLPTVTAGNVTGCTGTPVSLIGSPAGGTFSVTNPYTGPSTTYTYTYTNGNGCTNTSAPATITVNPLPTVTAGNVTGCTGTPVSLSGSPAGGTFSVANPYSGPSTNYTYTYTNGNGCTNTSTPATITVNPLPTVTAGNVSGCAGTPVSLSGSPAGGTFSVANPYTGPSTTYTYSYTNGNGCTNTSASANITVNPLPTVSFSGLASTYNVSASGATLTGTPAGGTFSGPGISGNTFSPAAAGVGGPYTISYSYTNGNGCSNSTSQNTTVVNCATPAIPASITSTGGTSKICPGDSKSYSIAVVSGATSYTWIPPTGGTVVSGQGTRFVTIQYNSGFVATANLGVTANNACGSSLPRTLSIVINTPVAPGTITMTGGIAKVCPGDSRTYSIAAVSNATSYTWTSPTGGVISSGQGTTTITVSFNAGFTANGFITVKSNNGCGSSVPRSYTVTRNVPAIPGVVSGQTAGLCSLSGIPYSVTNVSGVTYNWGFSVANAAISTGQGTNAITVNYLPGFVTGNLQVTASNGCGISPVRNLAVATTPAVVTSITGSATACANQSGVPYSIAPVSTATSYTWIVPTGATISDGVVTSTSTSLNTTSNAVTVNFATTAGSVRVRSTNACGSSAYFNKAVTFNCRSAMVSSEMNLNIFPVPVNEILNISFESTIETNSSIRLINLIGKEVIVLSGKSEVGNNESTLDLTGVTPGIYFLEVVNGDQKSVEKIVVE
ncbi:MAG: T9SS type A sorting domain-containing protein [Bacteroidetes bacterium]|nr:T9SS type A sorting domain-containing protein [Bacteroidota bacterium]